MQQGMQKKKKKKYFVPFMLLSFKLMLKNEKDCKFFIQYIELKVRSLLASRL